MKPKVLFILHLPPPVYGATVANQYIVNSEYIKREFDTDYINLATNEKLLEVNKATFTKFFKFLSIVWQVFRTLVRNKYDVCYISLTASGPAFYKDLVIIAIVKMFRVKILYFFHNKGIASASENRVNHYLYKFAFHKTKSVILSKYLYSDVKKYVNEKDVYYCPYGIPQSGYEYANDDSEQKDVPCQLLFLGNMMVEKGVLVLLEACKLLHEKNYEFECNFVGGWTDISADEFNGYVNQYELSGRVFAHGPKYNKEKSMFFHNSDIFVFPTYYHYETFGLVNLEAMQHGLPIVSTPEGGIPDAVIDGETGFLVPSKNVEALTNKLEILIQNPDLRHKMGKAGKSRVPKFFTLEKFETNITNILKDVAKGS